MPKKEINYNNTIIYKIVCNDLNIQDLYIGHTTNFIKRKTKHKSNCSLSNGRECNLKVYQAIRSNGGWDNWSMIEIEKFECNDRNEAIARERFWFETLQAKLNTQHPNHSKKESGKMYRENNKEKAKLYRKQYTGKNKDRIREQTKKYREINKANAKQYREVNKESISQRRKVQFTCSCGSIVRMHNKFRHQKSLKHLKYLATSEIA
jgi:hypothetical protein